MNIRSRLSWYWENYRYGWALANAENLPQALMARAEWFMFGHIIAVGALVVAAVWLVT